MKPVIRIRFWCYSFSYSPFFFISKFFPGKIRMIDILNCMSMSNGISGFKIERSEINTIKCLVINSMECNPDKALLKNIFAFKIQLYCSFGKLNIFYPDYSFSLLFTDLYCAVFLIRRSGYFSIYGYQLFFARSLPKSYCDVCDVFVF